MFNVRTLILVTIALVGLSYWMVHKRQLDQAKRLMALPLAAVRFDEAPIQTITDDAPIRFKEFTITPVANFLLRARVLSVETYAFDGGSSLSPVDFALGWGRMAEPSIYQALDISQGGRFYYYRWSSEPPIPLTEIIRHSANMHLIPASPAVKQVLMSVKPHSWVKIKGRLVNASKPDGWFWQTSQSREDSGAGACELVWVEAVMVE